MKVRQIKREQLSSFLILVAMLLLSLSTVKAYAQFNSPITNFSADSVELNSDGSIMSTSKLYVTEDAIRVDGLPSMGVVDTDAAFNLSILVFKNQDKQYFYNHDKKRVFISQADKEIFQGDYKSMGDIIAEKIIGSEKVSGYLCDKKEIEISYGIVGQTFKNKLIVWESKRFEFPLRVQDEDGNIQEIRNINTGKPADNWFKPLTGYQKVNSMLAVMGMDLSEKVQDLDISGMMEQMNQAVGDNLDPEQKAKMLEMMQQTMDNLNGADKK